MMIKRVFDLEGNGLLDTISKIWCICYSDLESNKVHKYGPENIEEGIEKLREADILIGHNICGFDLLAIEKLYPYFRHTKRQRDTLCMSKLFFPERPQHGLGSYGIQFGRYKPEHEDWSQFSEEMLHRCSEDVEINKILYKYLLKREAKGWDWLRALQIEQDFSRDQALQELEGVDIDVDKAACLVEELDEELEAIDSVLLERLPIRVINNGPVNKPFKKDRSYSAMAIKYFELVGS